MKTKEEKCCRCVASRHSSLASATSGKIQGESIQAEGNAEQGVAGVRAAESDQYNNTRKPTSSGNGTVILANKYKTHFGSAKILSGDQNQVTMKSRSAPKRRQNKIKLTLSRYNAVKKKSKKLKKLGALKLDLKFDKLGSFGKVSKPQDYAMNEKICKRSLKEKIKLIRDLLLVESMRKMERDGWMREQESSELGVWQDHTDWSEYYTSLVSDLNHSYRLKHTSFIKEIEVNRTPPWIRKRSLHKDTAFSINLRKPDDVENERKNMPLFEQLLDLPEVISDTLNSMLFGYYNIFTVPKRKRDSFLILVTNNYWTLFCIPRSLYHP